jgi:hypothetical protein
VCGLLFHRAPEVQPRDSRDLVPGPILTPKRRRTRGRLSNHTTCDRRVAGPGRSAASLRLRSLPSTVVASPNIPVAGAISCWRKRLPMGGALSVRQYELGGARVGERLGHHPTGREVHSRLLANKADENFSCYPSIRMLMAESGAGRSTVLRAEPSRSARLHDPAAASPRFRCPPLRPLLPESPSSTASSTRSRSGAPRSRYGTPLSRIGTGPSHSGTGAVSKRHPTGSQIGTP